MNKSVKIVFLERKQGRKDSCDTNDKTNWVTSELAISKCSGQWKEDTHWVASHEDYFDM